MGIRAAALGQVELDNVTVPLSARLGEDGADRRATTPRPIALSRLGWAALAVGTSHAVLDYVIPYVKEREAFGEPIAHRQSVAFMCANIAIELDGLRLITWRGAVARRPGPAVRPRGRAGQASSAPTRACRSASTACSCSAATATPRNTRSNAGTAICGPSASPRAS